MKFEYLDAKTNPEETAPSRDEDLSALDANELAMRQMEAEMMGDTK